MNGTQREDGTMGYVRSMSVARGWRTVLLGLLVLVASFAWLAGASRWTAAEARAVAPENAGSVVAWGDNAQGQATVPGNLGGVRAIAAGGMHSLALKSDGSVVAWGLNASGQATVPYGLSGVADIAAGGNYSMALKNDGSVVAWGSNGSGQTNVPVGLSGVRAIAAGQSHSMALKADGSVVAWGSNGSGQATVPVGLSGVTDIAAGRDHSLALKDDGSVVAWGNNISGQANVPAGLSGVTNIAAGVSYSLALKADGTVVAWGINHSGQTNVPVGLSGVADIAAGWNHSLARKDDGSVVAWGENIYGQTTVPGGIGSVMAVAAGGSGFGSHSMAIVDTTAPAAVDYFDADAGEGQVSLSWSNPPAPDFRAVRVLRSTTGPATSPQPDASQATVYEGTAESFTDTGLANGTTYFYTIYARDDAGNFSPRAREMATPADKTAPSVVATAPVGKNVARTANVTATFSEAMDEQSVEASRTVKLVKKGTTTPVAAVVTYDPTTQRATLNPERSLVRGATYMATVTTGATDLAGNPLAANKAWSFAVRR